MHFILLVAAALPGPADDRAQIQGVWKLVSYEVDVAWNPAWVGTEQSRSFKVEDNRLSALTPRRVMPNWPDKGMARSIITFERGK